MASFAKRFGSEGTDSGGNSIQQQVILESMKNAEENLRKQISEANSSEGNAEAILSLGSKGISYDVRKEEKELLDDQVEENSTEQLLKKIENASSLEELSSLVQQYEGLSGDKATLLRDKKHREEHLFMQQAAMQQQLGSQQQILMQQHVIQKQLATKNMPVKQSVSQQQEEANRQMVAKQSDVQKQVTTQKITIKQSATQQQEATRQMAIKQSAMEQQNTTKQMTAKHSVTQKVITQNMAMQKSVATQQAANQNMAIQNIAAKQQATTQQMAMQQKSISQKQEGTKQIFAQQNAFKQEATKQQDKNLNNVINISSKIQERAQEIKPMGKDPVSTGHVHKNGCCGTGKHDHQHDHKPTAMGKDPVSTGHVHKNGCCGTGTQEKTPQPIKTHVCSGPGCCSGHKAIASEIGREHQIAVG